nr:NAD-dependent epimerase/dehydratase family protein [uncultured Cohaesibacter sp.]
MSVIRKNEKLKRVFITGTAGFIGFHLAKLLLAEGFAVHGFDAITDYYDVRLKERRHAMLFQHERFDATVGNLEDADLVNRVITTFKPDIIVHLAGQAGVRYSMENPRSYLDSNIVGSFNILEAAHEMKVEHLLMASSSSVYGANEEQPFRETDKVDLQMSFYAATKKANENMAHSYAHLWNLPTTMFRFFTVYGPWGRPDMALFKFTDAILDGRPIDIYNNGELYRDFTYVDDLVRAIRLLIDAIPERPENGEVSEGDSLSPVAPFRVVNIGNSNKVRLLDFVDAIEVEIGIEAKRNYLPMQKGDVYETYANCDLLKSLTGYAPRTDIRAGVGKFVDWFRDYYEK